ncbi:MAG: ChaN family lipoprotein, partial [Betaproteobacteria bacterium]|nr:ChaN family lipoprotein [Betaproteobacteria bacterium]
MGALAGCAITPQHDWEARLRGNAIVLLGELHDNAEHHRERLAVLQRAFAAGWRPAIAMEQIDRERQTDIDRARQEKPRDVEHLISAIAKPAKAAPGANWNWGYYRPFIALALQYDVPLVAVNLSNADTGRIVREGYAAVFDADTLRRLRLDRPVLAAIQAAQEREIDVGHCNALPAKTLPAMARAQFARDAVMADIIAQHAARGVVLIAGNGHVRRDIGVPHWLSSELRAR